jgi:hypothetical protein
MTEDRLELQVSIDGQQCSGLLDASIETTNCFSADTYSLTFAISPNLSDRIAYWSTVSSGYVEVSAIGFATYGPAIQSLITGMIDTVHVDPIRGTVGIEGRDLSSSMIDSYRQQDFVNQTASEIVSTIARYHGLQPQVMATSERIGRYYGDGYSKLSLGQFSRLQSDWDAVVLLARHSGYDAFVQGQSLYFQPEVGPADGSFPISIQDVRSMRIERDLRFASSSTAAVQSWNSQNMAAYRSNNGSGGVRQDQGSSKESAPFLFSGSNCTPQQVDDLAMRYAQELDRLGTLLHLDMPWDLALSPRAAILLNGTNSSFDTMYKIDSIERRYSSYSGSSQVVRAAQVPRAH